MPGDRGKKRRRLPPLEKQVQQQIKAAAHQLGFTVSDFSQPRRTMQTPGIPDLYLQHVGKQFRCWVEVKRPGGKPSEAQKRWFVSEWAAGGIAFTAESVEQFVTKLGEHGFPVAA